MARQNKGLRGDGGRTTKKMKVSEAKGVNVEEAMSALRFKVSLVTGALAVTMAGVVWGGAQAGNKAQAARVGSTVVGLGMGFICALWLWLRVYHSSLYYHPKDLWLASDSMLLAAVNPLQLSITHYLGLLAPFVVSKMVLDWLVELALIRLPGTPLLPARDPADPGKKSTPALVGLDYAFLACNQLIEFTFTLHMFHFVMASPSLSWDLTSLNAFNTLLALVLLFAIDDLLYAPTHRFMHWGPVYWLVHKHHHKQKYPMRGYSDAANETPMEQLLGLSCVWITMQVVPVFSGLHVVTIMVFFVMYAATPILNHHCYDVKLWLGFGYSVGSHEMHHRLFNVNYAQNFMFWDRIMGTYKDYHA